MNSARLSPYLFSAFLGILLINTSLAVSSFWSPTRSIFDSGNYINDLYFFPLRDPMTDQFDFITQAQQWTLQRKSNQDPVYPENPIQLASCGEYLGGVSVFTGRMIASRVFKSLAIHTWIYLSLEYVAIDNWRPQEDSFYIEIDRKRYGPWFPARGAKSGNKCGNSAIEDWAGDIKLQVPHSGDSLTLRIVLNISESAQAGFAFRNLAVKMSSAAPVDAYNIGVLCPNKICFLDSNKPFIIIQPNVINSCTLDKFWDPSSFSISCSSCPVGCKTCVYPGTESNCTACQETFTWSSKEKKCIKCPANCLHCEIVSDEVACKICESSFSVSNSACTRTCPTSETPQVIGERRCMPNCVAPQPFRMYNWTCGSKCPSPLNSVSQAGYCTYACARHQFLKYDGSCIDTCNLYSWTEGDSGFKFCGGCPYPDIQFLYRHNNSCLISCKPEQIEKGENNINFCNIYVGNAKNKQTVTIGSETLSVLGQELPGTLPADNSLFEINKKTYWIDITWAFFSLNQTHPHEYYVENWESDFNCGCREQICGEDCEKGDFCNHHFSAEACSSENVENFCWNLHSKGRETRKAYALNLISIISLTNYSGPLISPLEDHFPGYTITNRGSSGFEDEFIFNAKIIDYKVEESDDEDNELVYAETVQTVIPLKALDVYNKSKHLPEVIVDLRNSTCNLTSKRLSISIASQIPDTPIKHYYNIVNLPKKTMSLTDLGDRSILTPEGTTNVWVHQSNMSVLDPCSQMFVNLFKHPSGYFYIKQLPISQKLSTKDDIICIAVNEDAQRSKDFVLYELKNGTALWTASTRFIGILGSDYVENVKLRVATDLVDTVNNLPLSSSDTKKTQERAKEVAENLEVHIEIYNDKDGKPILEVALSPKENLIAIECKIHVSTNCRFTLPKNTPFKTYSLNECGVPMEKGFYSCSQAIQGHFFLPDGLSSFRGKNLEDPIQQEIFSILPTAQLSERDHMDPRVWPTFWENVFFIWLNWDAYPSKLLFLIMVAIVIAILIVFLYLPLRQYFKKMKKERGLGQHKKFEDIIETGNIFETDVAEDIHLETEEGMPQNKSHLPPKSQNKEAKSRDRKINDEKGSKNVNLEETRNELADQSVQERSVKQPSKKQNYNHYHQNYLSRSMFE